MLLHKFAFCLLMTSYLAFREAVDVAAHPEKGSKRRPAKPSHRNDAPTLDTNLDNAERIVARLASEIGEEQTSQLLEALAKKEMEARRRFSKVDAYSAQPSCLDLTADDDDDDEDLSHVPYGFWPRFQRNDLHVIPSAARKVRLQRALKMYAVRLHGGCGTRMAFRGLRKGASKRSNGGANNATKAIGLGFALLQYFVNVVQSLQCRADSAMLMAQARELRKTLLDDPSGLWTHKNLPKLIGNAGAKWFERWRRKYGISTKVTGMELKVSWRKL